jgi:hypothetical protein
MNGMKYLKMKKMKKFWKRIDKDPVSWSIAVIMSVIAIILITSCKKEDTWSSYHSNLFPDKSYAVFCSSTNMLTRIRIDNYGTCLDMESYTLTDSIYAYRVGDSSPIWGKRYVVEVMDESRKWYYLGWNIVCPVNHICYDSLFHTTIFITQP